MGPPQVSVLLFVTAREKEKTTTTTDDEIPTWAGWLVCRGIYLESASPPHIFFCFFGVLGWF